MHLGKLEYQEKDFFIIQFQKENVHKLQIHYTYKSEIFPVFFVLICEDYGLIFIKTRTPVSQIIKIFPKINQKGIYNTDNPLVGAPSPQITASVWHGMET